MKAIAGVIAMLMAGSCAYILGLAHGYEVAVAELKRRNLLKPEPTK